MATGPCDSREITTQLGEVLRDPRLTQSDELNRSWLLVIRGLDSGASLEVVRREQTIGRGPDNDLVLQDEGISRRHAGVVRCEDGRVLLRDLGSTNGITIDGHKVRYHRLRGGDKLLMGLQTVLRYEVRDAYDADYERQVHQAMVRDWLTGTHNRRHLHQQLSLELAVARRHAHPIAVLMLDLDGFKRINDRHGHALGDRALVVVCEAVQSVLRAGDLLARVGGEEFAVLGRQTGLDGANTLAERVLTAVRSARVPVDGATQRLLSLTVSVGGVVIEPDTTLSADQAMQAADANLYRAKVSGRDCKVVSSLVEAAHAPVAGRRLITTETMRPVPPPRSQRDTEKLTS